MSPSLFLNTWKAARRACCPLVAITTGNQVACRDSIRASFTNGDAPPLIEWNVADGAYGLNDAGTAALMAAGLDDTAPLTKVFQEARRFPSRTVLFVINAHRFLGRPGSDATASRADVAQSLQNLREPFKSTRDESGNPVPRTVVLLGPSFNFPEEVAADVVVLDEPLPDAEALGAIVDEVTGWGEREPLDVVDDVRALAVDRCRGLTAFLAEQNVAMALRADGTLDLTDLADRQMAAIGSTPGLTVTRGGLPFSAVGGLDGIKTWIRGRANGPRRPRLVVRIDEIDKQLGQAAQGDTSGTSQDQTGVILKELDDNNHTGFLALGGPGGGKTYLSLAIGAELGIPALTLDLPALKDKFVGASEGRIRQAFKVINALAGPGGALFVGTCNRVDGILPEVKRRFRAGTWVFDKPSKVEREAIWTLTLTRYGLPLDAPRPDDTDWTGADIRNLCEEAYASGSSLIDARRFIVPVVKSDPQVFDKVREQAVGRFLSAANGGEFTLTAEPVAPTVARRRPAVE